jgi:hypothetical protein
MKGSILLPSEVEPLIARGRPTFEIANGRRATAGASTALDGETVGRTDNLKTKKLAFQVSPKDFMGNTGSYSLSEVKQ